MTQLRALESKGSPKKPRSPPGSGLSTEAKDSSAQEGPHKSRGGGGNTQTEVGAWASLPVSLDGIALSTNRCLSCTHLGRRMVGRAYIYNPEDRGKERMCVWWGEWRGSKKRGQDKH